MFLTLRTVAALGVATALLAPPLYADVLSVEIVERHLIEDGQSFGERGPYEAIVGRVTFGPDPFRWTG